MAHKELRNSSGPIAEVDERKRQELLQKYLEKSAADGIDAGRSKLPRVSGQELAERRRQSRLIRAYAAQSYTYMTEHAGTGNVVFLTLDKDGVVIRIHGSQGILARLERKGITKGSRWSYAETGANAVTVGMEERRFLYSAGTENHLRILQDLRICYAPLVYEDSYEDSYEEQVYLLGGMVSIVPLELDDSPYRLANALGAGNMLIRISMAMQICASYEENHTYGIGLLDINQKTGTVAITHHNHRLFEMLGRQIPSYREAYFKPLEELIDPYPSNREFWELIRSGQNVRDRDMTIKSGGILRDYLVTTRSRRQPALQVSGTYLQITTKRQIAEEISGKTSNNAILNNTDIIFHSKIMRARLQKARLVAQTDNNVMLIGESGVGKDVFAQAIHNMSSRRKGPFIAVNCGALPRDLIASELFGYDEGAFTGARKGGNIGKFELANGGTLFLDEIGELPLELQATLLRAVEQKQFSRLGSSRIIHADIKIISATNADLDRMIRERRFREDLMYRLGSMQIALPPLREREDDAVLLAEHFAKRTAARVGRPAPVFTQDAKQFLVRYPWYGNVRELQSTIDCVVQLYDTQEITADLLRDNVNPFVLREMQELQTRPSYMDPQGSGTQGYGMPGYGAMGGNQDSMVRPYGAGSASERPGAMDTAGEPGSWEGLPTGKPTREAIIDALEAAGGNRTEAARLMGIPRRTFYRYLQKYGIR